MLTKQFISLSNQWHMRMTSGILIVVVLFMNGCAGVGPGTVARDRFDYVTAISESWKRQTLLNLVKTRYVDAPVFMDVTSVINQYAIEGQISLGAAWMDSPGVDSRNIGGSGKYTDRPTITYSPIMGEKFTKSFMTPIPIPGILFLLQSGYAADYVLRICVHAINGMENQYGGSISGRSPDPRFLELMTALRKIQDAGAMGMRVKPMGDRKAVAIFFRSLADEVVAAELKKVRNLLGLDPEALEFNVVYGSIAANNTEIAILSRSMLQVMIDLASYIDVPDSDIAEGRVYASPSHDIVEEAGFKPLIQIKNSISKPGDAHVTVHYRNRWFWIDDRDYPSKSIFMFYMLLSSLTETGGTQAAPIVTVPTN